MNTPDGDAAGHVLSGFVQDEWRAGPGLSVRAGVRLQWQDPPADLGERKTDVLPRLGVAWQPLEGSETVVRALLRRRWDDGSWEWRSPQLG